MKTADWNLDVRLDIWVKKLYARLEILLGNSLAGSKTVVSISRDDPVHSSQGKMWSKPNTGLGLILAIEWHAEEIRDCDMKRCKKWNTDKKRIQPAWVLALPGKWPIRKVVLSPQRKVKDLGSSRKLDSTENPRHGWFEKYPTLSSTETVLWLKVFPNLVLRPELLNNLMFWACFKAIFHTHGSKSRLAYKKISTRVAHKWTIEWHVKEIRDWPNICTDPHRFIRFNAGLVFVRTIVRI